jgi:integrase
MPIELTDAGIKALRPRRERYEVGDLGTNLRLRVWPNGSKRWSVMYHRRDGALRRLSLGPFGSKPPALSLAAARRRAAEVLADARRGADPQGERRAARAAGASKRAGAKLGDLLDQFIVDQAPTWRPATLAGWKRYIAADLRPALGRRVPAEITPDDIIRFVEDLKRQRGPISVARAYEALRRFFRWAAARRKIPASPCANLEARELVARAKISDRVFDDVELVAILAGATATRWRHVVALVLYTGCRGSEARGAEWSEVDERAQLWTIPASRSKTGERRRVPLSSGAVAVLDELRGDDERWLFPAPTASGHQERDSSTVDRVRRISGVEDFNLHHVRRTVRQRLTDRGVALHVAEAVLGHLPPKIVRTYSPSWEPLKEMAAALESWGAEIARIAGNRLV